MSENYSSIYLNYIINHIPHYIFWKDRQSRFLGCNQRFARATGFQSANDIIGKTDYDMPWSEQAAKYIADDHAIMTTGMEKLDYEEEQSQKEKQAGIMLVSKVPMVNKNQEIIGVLGIYTDITERKQAEKLKLENEVRKVQLAVQEELAHFSRINSMGAVAVSIAHELNQPLTAVSTYTSGLKRRLQMLPRESLPKEIWNVLDAITHQAQRAGNIIHELKNFLRKDNTSKEYLNINPLIENMLIFIKHKLTEQNIHIILQLAPDLPATWISKVQIEQVIVNLLNNASDAINESNNKQRLIIIRTQLYQTNMIRISIFDSGVGMSPEHIKTIFTPFVTSKSDGMGMGLPLCYNIVEKHLGRIEVTSRLGRGAIFHVVLPVDVKEEKQ